MKTIYIDSEFRCHITNDGAVIPVETDFFDAKCDTFIEGYVYDDRNGRVQVYPWKPYAELDAAQREYERQVLAELQANSIAIAELEAAYQEGVNSAYD